MLFRSALRFGFPRQRSVYLAGAAAAVLVSVQEKEKEKLPIYTLPDPSPGQNTDPNGSTNGTGNVLQYSTTVLESHIRSAREKLEEGVDRITERVGGIVGRWVEVEGGVEARLKSLLSPSEHLTPPLLYITTLTLLSTFPKSLPKRLLLPPLVLITSSTYFLPQTTRNIRLYLGELEDRYLPGVSEKHEKAKAHAGMGWERVRGEVGEARGWVERGVVRGGGVLRGVFGLREEEEKEKQGKVLSALKEANQKASEATEVIKEKIERVLVDEAKAVKEKLESKEDKKA